jgi:hypothetical protein
LYAILWNALETEQSGLMNRKLLCLLYIPILTRTSDQVDTHRICNQEGQGTAACKIVSSGILAYILAAVLKALKLHGICCVPLTPELLTFSSLLYWFVIPTHSTCMQASVHSNAHKVIAGFFLSPDPEVT